MLKKSKFAKKLDMSPVPSDDNSETEKINTEEKVENSSDKSGDEDKVLLKMGVIQAMIL